MGRLGAGGLQFDHLGALHRLGADHLAQTAGRIPALQGLSGPGQGGPDLLQQGAAGENLDLGEQLGGAARHFAGAGQQGRCPGPRLGAARGDLHPRNGPVLGRAQEVPQQAGDEHDQEDHGKDLQAPPVAASGLGLGIDAGRHIVFEGVAQGGKQTHGVFRGSLGRGWKRQNCR